MGQHADRPTRLESRLFAYQTANRTVDGSARGPKMVPSSEIGKVPAVNRPEPTLLKDVIQLRQIKIHHKESILKDILDWLEPSMTYLSLVDCAVHDYAEPVLIVTIPR